MTCCAMAWKASVTLTSALADASMKRTSYSAASAWPYSSSFAARASPEIARRRVTRVPGARRVSGSELPRRPRGRWRRRVGQNIGLLKKASVTRAARSFAAWLLANDRQEVTKCSYSSISTPAIAMVCPSQMQPQRQKKVSPRSGFSATSPMIRRLRHTRYQHYVRTRSRRKPSWGSGATWTRKEKTHKKDITAAPPTGLEA
jgi:hypothetical protein